MVTANVNYKIFKFILINIIFKLKTAIVFYYSFNFLATLKANDTNSNYINFGNGVESKAAAAKL